MPAAKIFAMGCGLLLSVWLTASWMLQSELKGTIPRAGEAMLKGAAVNVALNHRRELLRQKEVNSKVPLRIGGCI